MTAAESPSQPSPLNQKVTTRTTSVFLNGTGSQPSALMTSPNHSGDRTRLEALEKSHGLGWMSSMVCMNLCITRRVGIVQDISVVFCIPACYSLMMFTDPLADLIPCINPQRVISYAEKRGWERRPSKSSALAIFQRVDDPDSGRQLIIPMNPDFDDFARRMTDAITRLSEFEKRTTRQIVVELLQLDNLESSMRVGRGIYRSLVHTLSLTVGAIRKVSDGRYRDWSTEEARRNAAALRDVVEMITEWGTAWTVVIPADSSDRWAVVELDRLVRTPWSSGSLYDVPDVMRTMAEHELAVVTRRFESISPADGGPPTKHAIVLTRAWGRFVPLESVVRVRRPDCG